MIAVDETKVLDLISNEALGDYLGLTEDTIASLKEARISNNKLVVVLMNKKALGLDVVSKLIEFV